MHCYDCNPVRYDRIPTIVFLMALILQVGGTMMLGKRWTTSGDGDDDRHDVQFTASTTTTLLDHIRETFASFAERMERTSQNALWTVSKCLLSGVEWASSAWDVTLNVALSVLKTGRAAYGTVAANVGGWPVLGFGMNGVNEVIKTVVDVAESNAKHDMDERKKAFASLNSLMDESGTRLSTATVRPPLVVRFPPN